MKPEEMIPQIKPASSTSGDINMKPSMVVQQQRQIQMGIHTSANHHHQNNNNSNNNNQSKLDTQTLLSGAVQQQHQQQQHNQLFDQDGLVIPKKVLPHPISGLSGIQQQPVIRDLNRELKFNQIRGKNVLDNKSELKKALEKLEENKRKKEAEQEKLNRRSSLELRLEERAERIAKETHEQDRPD